MPSAYSVPTEPRLRQGTILEKVPQTVIVLESLETSDVLHNEEEHQYSVILSQDCDLVQDYGARVAEPGTDVGNPHLLPNVLFCEAVPWEALKEAIKGSDIKKRIHQNKDERYHFLSGVPAAEDKSGTGVPALVLDFKRYFTVPTDELYRRIEMQNAILKLRTVLAIPYAEHLSVRFCHFQCRVALEKNHDELTSY